MARIKSLLSADCHPNGTGPCRFASSPFDGLALTYDIQIDLLGLGYTKITAAGICLPQWKLCDIYCMTAFHSPLPLLNCFWNSAALLYYINFSNSSMVSTGLAQVFSRHR